MAEDPAKAGLLYCGTEFGIFFSPDGGKRWVPLKGGMPTIAVRDIAIQKREGDLVIATFGAVFKGAFRHSLGRPALLVRAKELRLKLTGIQEQLSGDRAIAKFQEPVPPSISERVQRIVHALWSSTSAPTGTQQRGYEIAAQQFAPVLASLRTLADVDLKELETKAEAAGAPWTTGRVPAWKPE